MDVSVKIIQRCQESTPGRRETSETSPTSAVLSFTALSERTLPHLICTFVTCWVSQSKYQALRVVPAVAIVANGSRFDCLGLPSVVRRRLLVSASVFCPANGETTPRRRLRNVSRLG